MVDIPVTCKHFFIISSDLNRCGQSSIKHLLGFFFLRNSFNLHHILLCYVSIRFRKLTKQEGSSQMLNLFLHPNILEIRTRLQMWILKLHCLSFRYASFPLITCWNIQCANTFLQILDVQSPVLSSKPPKEEYQQLVIQQTLFNSIGKILLEIMELQVRFIKQGVRFSIIFVSLDNFR